MSAATPRNAPRFNHVPQLHELLTVHGGLPGVCYYQICIQNILKAESIGLGDVYGTTSYIIEGPKGEAHCRLMCDGEPINGVSPEAGARECFVDNDIYVLTGHPNLSKPDPKPEKETPSAQRQTPQAKQTEASA